MTTTTRIRTPCTRSTRRKTTTSRPADTPPPPVVADVRTPAHRRSIRHRLRCDELWDFDDPAGSEHRFRGALADLDLLATGACRADHPAGPRRRAAGPVRRGARPAGSAGRASGRNRGRVRMLLERGRLLNSSGDRADSIRVFVRRPGRRGGRRRGLPGRRRRAHAGHRRRRPARRLDRAGARHRSRDRQTPAPPDGPDRCTPTRAGPSTRPATTRAALPSFTDALDGVLPVRHGRAGPRRPVGGGQGAALRSARFDEALEIQLRLADAGPADGYVDEELAELGVALGRPADEVAAARRGGGRAARSRTSGCGRTRRTGSTGCAPSPRARTPPEDAAGSPCPRRGGAPTTSPCVSPRSAA